MFNLLTDAIIRIRDADGVRRSVSLPELLALLVEDHVEAFPALRPHQRHVWHAFLVQVSLLALGPSADGGDLPADAAGWAVALRALTPEFPDDEPWTLVVDDLSKPAFLQPPVPEGTLAGFKNRFLAPDELDMLVTAKNHDLKAATMTGGLPDDWLLALLSLQTQEGFLGAGNYGVSRMNGGFSSRPGIGLQPAAGSRFSRDLRVLRRLLVAHEEEEPRPEWQPYADDPKRGLVWLQAWDGTARLPQAELHPLYVEICRRVRLTAERGAIVARQTGTKAARIAPIVGGGTGDPWTPVSTKDGTALTVPADGFSYRRMIRLLFSRDFKLPPLAEPQPGERGAMTLVARALTRGQGKTEGYHERHVLIPEKFVLGVFGGDRPRFAEAAQQRVAIIGELEQSLMHAARTLVQGAPESVSMDAARNSFVEPLRGRLQAHADFIFFDGLFEEAILTGDALQTARRPWMDDLKSFARDLLVEAGQGLPVSSERRPRARAVAERVFEFSLRGKDQWKPYHAEAPREEKAA